MVGLPPCGNSEDQDIKQQPKKKITTVVTSNSDFLTVNFEY